MQKHQTKQAKGSRLIHHVDVSGKSLGRVATLIATLLRGKHKPSYVPYLDEGDEVVVRGVRDLKFSGKKFEQKVYHRYSGYPGGLKTKKLSEVFFKRPDWVLWHAVYQMLPPTRLRKPMMKRLNIEK
ncbi:50S ribosomal protein L13 [Candidatus Uhrbacteria bacterium]|nr:50S ribosomal protein L13 [Candidatus Uhrbacteria bacterium]